MPTIRKTNLMLTSLSRYAGGREVTMPKITVKPPIIFARIPSGVSFASRSEDRIYVTSDNSKQLGAFLFQFLHINYVPDYVPTDLKQSCFKGVIDGFLLSIKTNETVEMKSIKKHVSTSKNYFSINLSDSLNLHFITQPYELPAGLDLISKAWAVFEMRLDRKLIVDRTGSPIDRLESYLRNFTFEEQKKSI
jgi:hypothetical protein